MIVYQQAFDIYHSVFRLLRLLDFFNRSESVEVERLRIWDFYLLYPNKMSEIKLRREEEDIRKLIRNYIVKKENPYEELNDCRIMFEKIQPYQITAMKCLASYGVINKETLSLNRVSVINKNELRAKLANLPVLTDKETNAVKLLTSHFFLMPLAGEFGLKQRTGLIESKYDA